MGSQKKISSEIWNYRECHFLKIKITEKFPKFLLHFHPCAVPSEGTSVNRYSDHDLVSHISYLGLLFVHVRLFHQTNCVRHVLICRTDRPTVISLVSFFFRPL